MVYEQFLHAVRDSLETRLGDDYLVTLRQIPKNNGVVLDGVCIRRGAELAAPTIYLNPYYEEYEGGMAFDDIIEEIEKLYHDNEGLAAEKFRSFSHFHLAKDRIAYKLVNADKNRKLLEHVPHIPFCDLALVFYLFLDSDDTGQMTALIFKDHQKLWKVDTKELYDLARANTSRLFPAVLKNIEEVLREIAAASLGDQYEEDYIDMSDDGAEPAVPLYILTNHVGLNGACSILYDGVLKNFADQLEKDLYILPSSVHEVILVPVGETLSPAELHLMVSSINQSEVPVEDRLSDQIYLYTRSDNQIIPVSTFSESDEILNP